MSYGELCDCRGGEHPLARTSGPGGCGRYALNQTLGGRCSSCAIGLHRPCDRLTTTNAEGHGECIDCGWHSSYHAAGGGPASQADTSSSATPGAGPDR
jgi:hypothetical protein